MGSAITYYRRYTLQSLLGLSADDDDGNMAQKGALPKITAIGFGKKAFIRNRRQSEN